MNCPECHKEKNSHFDKQAIRLLQHCVDCKIKWEERPENDPENNRYVISYYYKVTDEVTIYAKSKGAAEEDFWNNYAEGENCEIERFSETTREEINERLAEQTKEAEE